MTESPLTEAEVAEAERELRVSFPEDYRAYLREVSAGGALFRRLRHGRALAHLAQQGVKATGVDLSPRMVELAGERWASLGVRIERAEVLDWLASDTSRYDAVYSIFGAAWFTDPSRLFPLIRERLASGGVFVFSQPPAIPGAYGPQGMYKGGFAGKAMFTYRYSYKPAVWERHLLRAGFSTAKAKIVDAPMEGHIGTLIASARA
ncbi:class I SAM-dependent methyltransferase [Streptomyces sp. NPDC048202]|uniref:class I SAM-dependent methyltransferase n=1 Tax=Streptomyces sp. NPDC048202 TaxID=3365514 RepID=UPI0037125976